MSQGMRGWTPETGHGPASTPETVVRQHRLLKLTGPELELSLVPIMPGPPQVRWPVLRCPVIVG